MAKQMNTPLAFAKAVTDAANADWESGELLDSVTETTRALLKFWFTEGHSGLRTVNFHEGQRQAILNVIWLHEVAKTSNIVEAYEKVAPDLLLEKDVDLDRMAKAKYAHPKVCVKMATGTGKTWVLLALMIWQYLNAKREEPGNFTKNFLVVAPGLIVYERLLDAFLGKEPEVGAGRNFEQSDIFHMQELFLPDEYRPEIFGFLRSSVLRKDEIGTKVTGDGLIAVANWHVLAGVDDDAEEVSGGSLDTASIIGRVLPTRPGKNAGNDLNALDNEFGRGRELAFLKSLPDLMVFNDEAHHIHENVKGGEVDEVKWQKSLTEMATPKGQRFIQVDFSATPYNQKGDSKVYFPHIVVNFELKDVILKGLVKMLTLDRRKEIASLELDFRAERDEGGKVVGLSEGQRVMLRAGLTKLRLLERSFLEMGGSSKSPKMMVTCEDTNVVPLAAEFLRLEGCAADDILEIHTTKKNEVSADEWLAIKDKLFNIDRKTQPRVVVSVLMLKEGFDVNNVCVIVPLRSSQSGILLEQTIGRGLRLMWREPEYTDLKAENRRKLLVDRSEPSNYLDILSIVEHPAFVAFYESLMEEGLIGIDERDLDSVGKEDITGDIVTVGLRDDYGRYDIGFPVVIRESEDVFNSRELVTEGMAPFVSFSLAQLKSMVPKTDEFISQEATKGTRFGDYAVHGGVMTANSYNEYVANLVRRVATVMSEPIATRRSEADVRFPMLQVQLPELARLTDQYIRHGLFGETFSPFEDNNWRVLLIDPVVKHIIKAVTQKLLQMQSTENEGGVETLFRRLSEVKAMPMRSSFSVETAKTVYTRTSFPSHSGRLEEAFVKFLDTDATVDAFAKVSEYKHPYIIFRYIKEDGMVGYYHPDFLVRCTNGRTYLVETKADEQVDHPNVRRKQKAVMAWVDKINDLPPDKRENTDWAYVLLGESMFYDWQSRAGNANDLLEFVKTRKNQVEETLF